MYHNPEKLIVPFIDTVHNRVVLELLEDVQEDVDSVKLE